MILIDRLHKYFQREFNFDELDSIKLKYSLEFIIGEISKFTILFFLFWISGKSTDFIYCSSVLLVIRLFTGGLHFRTYAKCLIFSGIFFYIIILLKYNINLNFRIAFILFIFSLFTTIIFAPICGESRPDYPHKKRQKFRLIGVVSILIYFGMYFFIHKSPYFINSVWVIALQSIQLLIAKGIIIYERKKINF
ncbi:accessory gene regulator ArgB-like protein [Tissierella sp. MB52-C2]|uniref:accessory gene regulator ArgB-like protein n=1 Tax=Tissierella sp. MB52-C2 TaxID=3070999 RepID=UPI0035AC1A41